MKKHNIFIVEYVRDNKPYYFCFDKLIEAYAFKKERRGSELLISEEYLGVL